MSGPIVGGDQRTVRAHPGMWAAALGFGAFVAAQVVISWDDIGGFELAVLGAIAAFPLAVLLRAKLVVRGGEVEVVRVFRRETVVVEDIVAVELVGGSGRTPRTVFRVRGVDPNDRWNWDYDGETRMVYLTPGLTRGHVARSLGLPTPTPIPKHNKVAALVLGVVLAVVFVVAWVRSG